MAPLGEPRSEPAETGMLATTSNAPAATQRARVAGVSIRLMLCPPAKSDPYPLTQMYAGMPVTQECLDFRADFAY